MKDNYTFSEHLHRYAVWTAARAVQRNFTTTENIKKAIEEAGLRQRVQTLARAAEITPDEFDQFHCEMAGKLKVGLEESTPKVTYGRLAKIIAVYLKTSAVIRNPDSVLGRVAHPPIDRILLQNLTKGDVPMEVKKLKHINWTQLDEVAYFDLISVLRSFCGDQPF